MAALTEEITSLQEVPSASVITTMMSHDSMTPENYYPDVEYECWSCGARSYHLKVCGLCQCAKYCNRECQTKHWSQHRKTCETDKISHQNFIKGGSFVEVNQECLEDECPEVYFLGLDKCVKNGHNNHSDFIGVLDFDLHHLPGVLRRNDVLEYIKAEAKMIVRVKVKFTSMKRPDTDACAKHRGTRFVRTASGLYVVDNPNEFKTVPCSIPNCHRKRDLGQDHFIYEGDLKIFTNKHVIFDDDEMAKTTVDFFYDDNDKKGIVQEYGVKLFYLKATSDKAFFKVTVHDKDLLQMLYNLDCERSDKYRKIPQSVIDVWNPYALLISHPHGMPKKISIGKISEITEENVTEETERNAKEAGDLQKKWYSSLTEEDYLNFMRFIGTKDMPVHKLWYDTPSCPGSSGGRVLFGGIQVEGIPGPFMANHNGYDLDSTLNFFKVIKMSHT